jgi:hypothetical protein
MPLVIVVKGDSKWNTIEELIDFAKKNPNKLNMGTPGINSVHHFCSGKFFKKNRGRLKWAILLIGCVMKLGFQLIYFTLLCFITLFSIKKWTGRLSIYAYLMKWHLKFCTKGMGLKEA